MNNLILPDLQAVLLCEDVRAERSGQQTLVGILGAIPTSVLPIGFFKLCLWTRWCGGVGKFTQRATIFDPEEKQPITETTIHFELTNMNAHATNIHFFAGVQFKRFGIYHIEVHLDDELKLRVPLPVVHMKEEG
jgi:hypothetical protein